MREIDPAAYVPEMLLTNARDIEKVRLAKEDKLRVRIVSGTIAAIAFAYAPFGYTQIATARWGPDAGWAGIAVLVLAWPLAVYCCISTIVYCCMLFARTRKELLPWLGACVCGAVILWMRARFH